ncbi:MAG: hypothetical protein AAI946_00420 [Candidatus Hodgkinia cicadicola]
MTSLRRVSLETDIVASLHADGNGRWHGATGLGFLDHMLAQFAAYSLIDLKLFCCGDLWTGWHHVAEDVGIVLGTLIFRICSKECKNRFSAITLPMDGSLLELSVDFSNRPRLYWDYGALNGILNATDDIRISHVVFDALVHNCGASVHANFIRVDNWHHAAEALFKAFGMCYKNALSRRNSVSASTKGKPKVTWR